MRRLIMYFLIFSTTFDVALSYFIFKGLKTFPEGEYQIESNPLIRFLIEELGLEITFFLIFPVYFLCFFFIIGLGLSNRFQWVYQNLKKWYWIMFVAKVISMIWWIVFLVLYFSGGLFAAA